MAKFDLAPQPKRSSITVKQTRHGAIILVFPRGNPWPSLALVGIAVVSLLFWHGIARFLRMDWSDLDSRALGMAGGAVLLGVVLYLSHTRVTVTDAGISRAFRLCGINYWKVRALFATIEDIGCEDLGTNPVIRISQTEGDSFIIEEFSSSKERDWVAGELNRTWRDAVAMAAADP